ncbi:MAG: hypothetical protein ABFD16_04075 [Thermoguttaceae bacterium]
MLDPAIVEHLADDDDVDLWELATNTILNDATSLHQDAQEEIFSQVGCCRHWIRPHQSRWTADGGFAWPAGYDKTTTGYSLSALPELEWSVYFKWTGTAWEHGQTGRRCLLLRVAIPGRTARHLQAAVHTIWTPRSPSSKERVVQLYGFRKVGGIWQLTATNDRTQ